jgi:small redox-active disulfide protein 2
MKIEVLGSGCAKCKKLFENAEKAVKDSSVKAEVSKVEDMEKIIGYGVMSTPSLVIDGVVKSAGRLPSPAEISGWIKESK